MPNDGPRDERSSAWAGCRARPTERLHRAEQKRGPSSGRGHTGRGAEPGKSRGAAVGFLLRAGVAWGVCECTPARTADVGGKGQRPQPHDDEGRPGEAWLARRQHRVPLLASAGEPWRGEAEWGLPVLSPQLFRDPKITTKFKTDFEKSRRSPCE